MIPEFRKVKTEFAAVAVPAVKVHTRNRYARVNANHIESRPV
jgi:hypothetical protein